jgi:hypothetical protein
VRLLPRWSPESGIGTYLWKPLVFRHFVASLALAPRSSTRSTQPACARLRQAGLLRQRLRFACPPCLPQAGGRQALLSDAKPVSLCGIRLPRNESGIGTYLCKRLVFHDFVASLALAPRSSSRSTQPACARLRQAGLSRQRLRFACPSADRRCSRMGAGPALRGSVNSTGGGALAESVREYSQHIEHNRTE